MLQSATIIVLLSVCLLNVTLGGVGFGPGDQEWGYIEVREGAHMFWWLYHTTKDVQNSTEKPLVIWLQGGPGASSTGYGNFEELGPLDLFLSNRNHTWVRDMNVLFIDNPVGTGFSYVDDLKYLTTDNLQIADDLVQLLRGFYEKLPQFKKVPLHIFSESYGGKMAAQFALTLYGEIKAKTIDCNLQSVSMGDAWISPMDSMYSWAPFLLNMGFIDPDGYKKVMASTDLTQKAYDDGLYVNATFLFFETENVISIATHGIDFYNVLLPINITKPTRRSFFEDNVARIAFDTLVRYDNIDRDEVLNDLMNGAVKETLKIPANVTWGGQSWATFMSLSTDFMKPVTSVVEQLLNETTIKVCVFTGQLDLIVATPGTVDWVNRLKWRSADGYAKARRNPIIHDGIIEGYSKTYASFFMYWANRAGHMVPNDNPAAMDYILRNIVRY